LITADVRERLEHTGVLFTQHEGDLGHIPDSWRGIIQGLCDALDATPQNAAELLQHERADHSVTKDELTKAFAEIAFLQMKVEAAERDKRTAEEDRQKAVQLVSEAVPRMESLNNAMSPGWLAQARELLEG